MIKVPLPRFVALLVILAIFFGLLNALITPFISHAGQQIGSPDSLTPRISSLENSSESVGDEWPMYRGALDHAGIGATTPLLGAAPLWVFTTDTAVITAPTVANGRVYAGSLNGSIYCINETTGTIEWTCNYQYVEWNIHPIFSTAAIACGCVYVGGYCQIYCLNATTGEYVWGYGPGIPGISIDSSPAVADGRIYVGSCGNVTCLNATTGALEWNYTTGDTVYSSPAIANGWVYVGSDDDNVYCLNATTGALKWNYTTGDNVYSSPAVANGYVYVGSDDYNLYCLNATTGARKWMYSPGSYVDSSPAIANGRVYVGSLDKCYCINATTGCVEWSYTTGDPVYSDPAIANGMVFIANCNDADNKGSVYCLNATTGALIWTYSIGAGVLSSPTIANGTVFIGNNGGQDNNGAFYGKIFRLPMIMPSGVLGYPLHYLFGAMIAATAWVVIQSTRPPRCSPPSSRARRFSRVMSSFIISVFSDHHTRLHERRGENLPVS